MYRYTTPTLTLNIKGIDFTNVSVFRVAIEQNCVEMLKEIPVSSDAVDAEQKTVTVELTQEETASMSVGMVNIQVRLVLTNGRVVASNIANVPLRAVLDEVVV